MTLAEFRDRNGQFVFLTKKAQNQERFPLHLDRTTYDVISKIN